MAFRSLFSSSAKTDDGLTQAGREAIVDLLHFGVYVDKHIALAEDKMVEDAARKMNWDPKISFDYYEGKSIGEVSRIGNDEKARAGFFAFIRERLPKMEERERAFKLLKQLYAVDGTTDAEAATLPLVRKELELR